MTLYFMGDLYLASHGLVPIVVSHMVDPNPYAYELDPIYYGIGRCHVEFL